MTRDLPRDLPRDLIVFGEDWGRHPSSTQHIMAQLAQGRRIAWINSVGLRRPRLNMRDLSRIAEKAGGVFGRPRAPGEKTAAARPANLHVIEPRIIPAPGNAFAAAFNLRVGARLLRRRIDGLKLNRPAVWISVPSAVDLLPALPPKAPVIYYCGDDFGALAGVDHAPVLACEARLAARARRVLAASEALAARFDAAKTVHLPHGVDMALFARPAPRADDLPPAPRAGDLPPAPRAEDLPTGGKTAGFYGSISGWLDQDLIAAAARMLPGWRFVFIGRVECDVSRLADLPNVTFLGPRPHAALPRYAQHWTASMLPFVDNAQIRACNPLKLREYMAAGTPVVSTPFPALAPYAGHIAVVSGAEAFAAGLKAAHKTCGNAARRRAQAEAVKHESWNARAAQAAAVIDGV